MGDPFLDVSLTNRTREILVFITQSKKLRLGARKGFSQGREALK